MKNLSKVLLTVTLLLLIVSVSFAQMPQYYNYNNVGSSSNTFPLGQTAGKAVQWLFLAGELNQPTPLPPGQQITTVYLFITTGGTRTYTQLQILMAQDTITNLTSGTFHPGPFDTVYFHDTTITAASTSWLPITLDHPFVYDPTKSLIFMVGQCAGTGSGIYVRQNSITGSIRRDWSVGGCPFVPSTGDANCLNFGVDVVPAASPTVNRCLLLPYPGVNTHYVAIPHQAGMVGWGNNITIEGWVRIGGTANPNTVLNKGGSSFDYQLGINSGTGNPFFRAGSSITIASPIAVPVATWTHLAVTYDGTTVKFYVNGVMLHSAPVTANLGSSTNEMRIGRGGSDPGAQRLDEIRLWSVARTQAEILGNMCNKWVPNSATGLKGKWHLDSTYTDSVNNWNGTPTTTSVGFDTMTFCPIVVNVKNYSSNIPVNYRLEQNYPNPFNPTTKIRFAIPKDGYVEMKLYDVLGKEVATLISDPYRAGEYIFDFNATGLSSGIYFYRLVSGDFSDTKSMMLIK